LLASAFECENISSQLGSQMLAKPERYPAFSSFGICLIINSSKEKIISRHLSRYAFKDPL